MSVEVNNTPKIKMNTLFYIISQYVTVYHSMSLFILYVPFRLIELCFNFKYAILCNLKLSCATWRIHHLLLVFPFPLLLVVTLVALVSIVVDVGLWLSTQ
jgi:hypothetical protein